jgi:DNA-binding transcriptional MerR regulator
MLKIGAIAKQTGVSVGTLRYYESLKLIQPSRRSENGYRYYDEHVVQRILFIRKAQLLQFSLADIGQILATQEQGYPTCSKVKALLDQQIDRIDTQIQHLHQFKTALEKYRSQWTERLLDKPNHPTICSLINEVKNDTKVRLSNF